MPAENIKVVTLNVNGFRSRESELRNFIQETGRNCVYALNDTRLSDDVTVKKIQGFSMLRHDRPLDNVMATAGGVALLIPDTWTCLSFEIKTTGDHFEALAAVILPAGADSFPFKILSIYNHRRKHFPPGIINDFKSMMFNGSPVPGILVGDLNCPHSAFGSRTTNEFGSRLLQLLNQENLVVFNDESPTYLSNSSGLDNVLDLVIGEPDTNRYIESCYVSGDVGSDHLPVVTCLKFKSDTEMREKVNLAIWAQTVDKNLENFVVDSNIDASIDKLNKIVKASRSQCTRKRNPRKRILPAAIMQNIQLRKALLQNRKRASSELVKKILSRAYNRLNRRIHKQIEEFDDQQWQKMTDEICDAEPNKMWHLYNKFKNNNKSIESPCTPLKTPNGSLAANDQQKCDEFARYLNTVHQTPDNPLFDTEFKNLIDDEATNEVNQLDKSAINPIHLPQFKQLLSETKRHSAAGEDYISYDLMKQCSDDTKQVFCNIINECISQNVFPRCWKEAKVVMLPKPGRDKNFACNYRPISLLSALGKMYERYIYAYLMKELKEKNFISPRQAGFTKGRNSQEHLFCLSQDISNGFKERKCTLGLFLDVKAAFDAVWKNGLKHKIKKIGLSNQIKNLLYAYLDNRTLRVCVNGSWSEVVELRAGTPQGGVLSPILYLIYVNDLTENLDLLSSSASQYADDTGLWVTRSSVATAKSDLQREMSKVEQWCRKWQVTLNPTKSKLVLFSKCPRHKKEVEDDGLSIQIFGESVESVAEAEYLGVVFDSRLTWEPQTKKILSKSYKSLNLLRLISSLSKKHRPDNLLKIYNSTIRSIFEYSSVCITNAADCHIEKLQVVQNQALRHILTTPSYVATRDLHDCSGAKNVKDHLIAFAKKRLTAMQETSPLIRSTIANFRRVQHIQENASILDVLGI